MRIHWWTVRFGSALGHALILCSVLGFAAWVVVPHAQAQATVKKVLGGGEEGKETGPVEVQTPPLLPDDEFDRGSPRTAVNGFLEATYSGDYKKAAEYLDLRNLPRSVKEITGERLARQLSIVLERALWIDVAALSMEPRGYLEDGLPSYRDRLGEIETEKKTFDILLQRVPRGDGVFIWKISNQTVAEVPQLYEHFGHGFFDEILPAWLFDIRVAGIHVQLWDVVAIVMLAALAYVVASGASGLLAWLLRRWQTKLGSELVQFFEGPVRLLMWVFLARYWFELYGPSVGIQAMLQAGTIMLVVLAWALLRLIDFSLQRVADRAMRKGQPGLKVLVPPMGTSLKSIVMIVLVLVWLDNIGFEVTTLIAGLGIGGLAVAFAAQKSLENVFGAITLYTSKPVQVGDLCKFGNTFGTVEEIGLRSTLVRTLDDTVVNVPNAELSNSQLENYSKRGKMWYHPRVRLRYETTPDQVRYILIEVRKLLYSHPKVLQEPASVRFKELGTYSLDLDIWAYVDVNDYFKFLEVAEDLNLRVMEIIAAAGATFALPSQTMYVEDGGGNNEERTRSVEAQVKEWREQRALYLPSFPQGQIAALRGKLDYPPTGSPEAAVRP